MAGITMQHVPMRTNTVTAVMTGEIDLVMSPYTTGVPAAKGGKVATARGLAGEAHRATAGSAGDR